MLFSFVLPLSGWIFQDVRRPEIAIEESGGHLKVNGNGIELCFFLFLSILINECETEEKSMNLSS